MTTFADAIQDPATARLIAEEALVIDVLERMCEFMEQENISRAELARRLGTSKANITQLFRGRNVGLKTIAAAVHVMGGVPSFHIGKPASEAKSETPSGCRFTLINGEKTAWRRASMQPAYQFDSQSSSADGMRRVAP